MDLDWVLAELLGKRAEDGVYLREPADEVAVEQMQAAAVRDLGRPVPEEYERLLRVTNGVQINNAYFKSAEGLVPENLDVPMPEVIVLGNAGNVDHYVYDPRDQLFAAINMGFPDERYATFVTFADLLVEVMKLEDVL
jgi:hypothetical protein